MGYTAHPAIKSPRAVDSAFNRAFFPMEADSFHFPASGSPRYILWRSSFGTVVQVQGATSASVRGQTDVAEHLLSQAVRKERESGYREPPVFSRPASESLGYAWLRAKEWDKAREAFNASLKDRPRNGHALFGIAQSYALPERTQTQPEPIGISSRPGRMRTPRLSQVQTARRWIAGSER